MNIKDFRNTLVTFWGKWYLYIENNKNISSHLKTNVSKNKEMKTILFPILILCLFIIGCKKEDDNEPLQTRCDFIGYKYYNGTQDTLGDLSNDYLVIGIDTTYSDNQIESFIANLIQFDQLYNYTIYRFGGYKFKEIPLKFNSPKNCAEITQIIDHLEQTQIVSYAHYAIQTDNCRSLVWGPPIGNLCVYSYGSNFYVKVFNENDLTDLNQTILATNTELVLQNQFMPKWYELRATKSSNGDGIAMANYFFETGLFEHSEPGISRYAVE